MRQGGCTAHGAAMNAIESKNISQSIPTFPCVLICGMFLAHVPNEQFQFYQAILAFTSSLGTNEAYYNWAHTVESWHINNSS